MTLTESPPTASPTATERVPSLSPGTRVEVRSSFDHQWSSGFEVIDGDDAGYRVRRLSDGSELPRTFPRDDLRRERERRRGGQWWY
jgi:hypothetical protein